MFILMIEVIDFIVIYYEVSKICYVLLIFGSIVSKEVIFIEDLFNLEELWKVLEGVSRLRGVLDLKKVFEEVKMMFK